MNKLRHERGGKSGFERTRLVMWGLRLERRDGEVDLRGWRPDLIRALAIFSAVSWCDIEVGSVGKNFFKVLKVFRVILFVKGKKRRSSV